MEAFDIRYTRNRPEEWDALVETIAQNIGVSEDHIPTIEQAAAALKNANDLETERLEVTAYYGWGLGMRGLAKALNEDKTRHDMAATISRNLTRSNARIDAMIAQPDANAFSRFTQAALTPIMGTLKRSYEAMPAAEHLASDALTIATRAHRGGFNPLGSDVSSVSPHVRVVRRGEASASIITSNATAGSIIAHSHSRAARAQATTLTNKQQNLLRFAVQSAALHTEEFQGALYADAVTYLPDGAVTLDRNKIPEKPQLPERRLTDIKHIDRLACPAIQVQFAIPGMLQLILDVERHQAA